MPGLYSPALAALLGVDEDGNPLPKTAKQDEKGRVKVRQPAAPGLDIPNPFAIDKVYGQGKPPSPDQSVPRMDPNPLVRIGQAVPGAALRGLAYSQEHIGGPIVEALPKPVQKAAIKGFEALMEGTGSATTGAVMGGMDADPQTGEPLVQGVGSFGIPIPTRRGLEVAKGALKGGASAYARNVMQDTPTLPSEELKKRGAELPDVQGMMLDVAMDVGNVVNPLAIAGPAVKLAAMLPILPAARAGLKVGQAAEKAGELAGKATKVVQRITSENTSLRQVPALFKNERFREALVPGAGHVDLGAGGHAELSTGLFEAAGVKHLPHDQFSRRGTVVTDTSAILEHGPVPTVSAANVLNVIAEPEARAATIARAADRLSDDGTAFFLIHQGDGSGVGKATTKGWQNNAKAEAYMAEIQPFFREVERHGTTIEARGPIREVIPGGLWDEWKGAPEGAVTQVIESHPVVERIRGSLTDDLLSPQWRQLKAAEPDAANSYGHCYAASEAAYHMLGGKKAGLTPMVARDADGGTHWWLQDAQGRIIDPTADQYTKAGVEPPYAQGVAKGFLTKEPSKRAQEIIRRASAERAVEPGQAKAPWGSEIGAVGLRNVIEMGGAAGGAAIGSAADDEHPLRGALLGAAAGYGAAKLASKAAQGFARGAGLAPQLAQTTGHIADEGIELNKYTANMIQHVPERPVALGIVDDAEDLQGAAPRGIDPAKFEEDKVRIGAWLDRQGIQGEGRAITEKALQNSTWYYEHRRIHRPWSEAEEAASQLAFRDVLQKAARKGTTLNDAETLLLHRQLRGASDYMGDVADAYREVQRLRNKGEDLAAEQIMRKWGVSSVDAMRQLSIQAVEEGLVVMKTAIGVRSEAGRALNIYKKFLEYKAVAKPDEHFAKMADALGADGADIADHIVRFAPGSKERYTFIRNLSRPDGRQLFKWYYMTGLLSGPATHARNLISNVVNMGSQTAGIHIGTAWEAARGRMSWADAKNVRQQFRRGMMDGIHQGYKSFLEVMRDGFTASDMRMLTERPPEVRMSDLFGANAAKFDTDGTQRYLNVVSRFLSASDQAAKQVVFSGALYAEAYQKASKMVREGKLPAAKMQEYALNIIKDPIVMDPDLWKRAQRFAQDATYQNDPGKVLRSIMQTFEGIDEGMDAGISRVIEKLPTKALRTTAYVGTAPLRYAGTTIMPFIKTPANVYKKYARVMGGGFMAAKDAGELENVMRKGEAMLGVTTFAALYAMMQADLIDVTGAGPMSFNLSDQQDKSLDYFYSQNPQHSIRIGSKWYGYQALGPLAAPLMLLGNLRDSQKRQGKMNFTAVASGVAQTGRSLLSASMLTGLMGLMGAFEDREGTVASRFFGRTVAGFVPLSGAARTARKIADPFLRDTSGESLGETLKYNVQNILPGASSAVPVRSDYAGNYLRAAGAQPGEGIGTAIMRAVSPVNVSPAGGDPIRRELERLGAQAYLTKPDKRLKDWLGNDLGLTKPQSAQLQAHIGRRQYDAAKYMLASPAMRNMPPEAKAQVLREIMAEARDIARDEFRQYMASVSTGRP